MNLTTPITLYALPVFVAMDKGYFSKAGIDLTVNVPQGSSTVLLPMLATGEIDSLFASAAPPYYNQLAQGFNIKAVVSMGQELQGRPSVVSLMVTTKNASRVKDFSDLKGLVVDGAVEGGTNSLIAIEAIQQAGLTAGKDVTLQYRARTTADMLALASNNAADVIAMNEPTGTQAVNQGLVVRWKTLADLAPWYQPGFVAASTKFAGAHPEAVEKFAEVVVATEREINQTNGQWTPELLASATKWTKTPADVVTAPGKVVYFEPNGTVSLDSLQRSQDVWVQQGLVKQAVDVKQAADSSYLDKALAAIGRV